MGCDRWGIRKSFIDTRSYVRIAKLVVDGKYPAAQLPDKPLDFASSYLLPGDEEIDSQAVTASVEAIVKEATDKAR